MITDDTRPAGSGDTPHARQHWPKPALVLSRCLELEPVRYNGQVVPYDFVRELRPWVTLVPVCPEVEIGLGVPRDPVRIVAVDGEARLLQPDTGRDLTEAMSEFAGEFLPGLEAVDGFILKNRSPSCGIGDVKIYQGLEASASAERGAGFFGGAVQRMYPGLAIEDEGRLRNYRIREHFLTKLFALARLRAQVPTGGMRHLIEFHAQHKFLLMAYDQERLRALGRIVANAEGAGFPTLLARYRDAFEAAVAQPPRASAVVNVLEHMSGYFSDRVSGDEKAFFRRSLQRYRDGGLPLAAVASVLRAWAVRFESAYLLPQAFFDPYPAELMKVSDSGKGRI